MSTDAVTNVVPLRAPDRTGPSNAAQFERLLTECRDLACQRLSQSLAGMLDKADDTLWELSNATQEREAQKLYAEAKDKLLPRRKDVEERFRSRFLAEFDNRVGPGHKAGGSFSDYSGGGLELGLVEEDDLNETLKVNDMAARLRRYCEEELTALDQRTGVLLGDANLQAGASPFSPQAICDAFKLTCRDIESEVKIRMVFVKLFDDHVLDDVRSIYKAVNALLVENSILPKIRYNMSRNRDGDAAPAAAGARPAIGGNIGPPATGAAVSAGEQDVFSVLQNLIAMNAGAMGAGVAPPAGGGGSPVDGPIQIPGFPPILGVQARRWAGSQRCFRAPRCSALSRASSMETSARRRECRLYRCRGAKPARPMSCASSRAPRWSPAWARWTSLRSTSWRCCSIRSSRIARSRMR